MSSFDLRLKESYSRAKLKDVAAHEIVQQKAENLAEVVGDMQPPLDRAGFADGFERAIKNGLDPVEAERLRQVVYGKSFLETVNDKPRFNKLIARTQEGFDGLRAELASGALKEEIVRSIPDAIKKRLTPEQIELVVGEVTSYCLALLDFFDAALATAKAQPDTAAGRTVATAQVHGIYDAYTELVASAVKPIEGALEDKA